MVKEAVAEQFAEIAHAQVLRRAAESRGKAYGVKMEWPERAQPRLDGSAACLGHVQVEDRLGAETNEGHFDRVHVNLRCHLTFLNNPEEEI